MFRTKKDVERHVSDALSKIDNENERNLRGYTFARLYFQVKDYETAKRYLACFLSVRDHHAPSHKLMAQIYEAQRNFENALQSFKRSLEIDSHQKEIILKICELYCQLSVDHETARYWADRAEQIFPHNDIVFRLRECLVSAEGEPDRQELENLIATELAAQPKNIDLRIKLLRLYLDTERVMEAYDHATKIESKRLFANSTDWYYLLEDVFEAYQEEFNQKLDSLFYIHFLTALDHLISLTLAEPHSFLYENGKKISSINDAAAVLLTFDQQLKKASEMDVREGSWTYFLHYMKGQLYYHMATLLMKRAKKDQGNWKESCRFSAALFLVGYTFKPVNLLQEIWFSKMEDNQKIFTNFFQQGALRTSFIGHVIMSLCREDKGKWLQKIKQDVCVSQVKERIYNRLFGSVTQKEKMSSSYYMQDSTFIQSSLEFPSLVTLQEYDKSAYKLCPESLHHLVWFKLHQRCHSEEFAEINLNEVFKGLQYSNKNLSKGSPESLCILDLEAYLQASVYQAHIIIEHKSTMHNARNQDSPLSFPPEIADPLCTKQQATWWHAAYGLFSCSIREKLGDHRRNLQHGLEVVRGIGNHGLEVQLVVHLARVFADKAEHLGKRQEDKSKIWSDNLSSLKLRATHYWNIALGMLDKLSTGQTLRVPKAQMFIGYDKRLSSEEIKSLTEEGKLYLAVCLMNSEKLEEAAELLGRLTSPYASYYLALTLKKAALQQEKSSNARTALLNKAKNALHETMDRVKDDKDHALNKEIYVELEDVESELAKDLNVSFLGNANNSEDYEETDGYDDLDSSSPAHNSVFGSSRNGTASHIGLKLSHSTPRPSPSFMTPRSKFQCPAKEHNQHIEPSPERLDAQIRVLAMNQDTLVKTLLQQQRNLLDTNKAIVEGLKQNKEVVEQLKKQLEELKISNFKFPPKGMYKKAGFMKGQGDDEEDYEYDANGLLEYYADESNDDYRASGYSYDPTTHMVHDATTAAPLNYVVNPAIPPGPPPPLSHYNYQYPPHPVLPQPAAAVGERPTYYHPTAGQGLPFSEGQQLPQFHFHVASPVVKPPSVLSSVPSIPQTLPPQPVIPQSPAQVPIASPWGKTVSVPHAFQIPLPTTSTFVPTGTMPQSSSHIAAASKAAVPSSQSELKSLLSAPVSGSISFGQALKLTSTTVSSVAPSESSSIFAGFSNSSGVAQANCSGDRDITVGSDVETHDLEREVMGDFKPLIPLPAEVVVETGEENELLLFEDRAKLYRFAEQEWKERGTGIVKILHHEGSGRVRLLMRRDQVLKVCANHYITSKMEIHAMKNSDKAWTWVAQDFADEELRPESFCIRFKTVDIAAAFKSAFEKALTIVKQAEEKSISASPKIAPVKDSLSLTQQSSFGTKFLPKSGSWICPTCYVSNAADKFLCVACETRKPGFQSPVSNNAPPVAAMLTSTDTKPFIFQPTTETTSHIPFTNCKLDASLSLTNPAVSVFSKIIPVTTSADTSKNCFGGFTFSTSPMVREIENAEKDREILVVSTKSKNGPQVTKLSTPKSSPFSGFSFKTSPTVLSTLIAVPTTSISTAATDSVSSIGGMKSTEKETIFGSKSIAGNLDFSALNTSTSNFLKGTTDSQGAISSSSPLFVTFSKEGRRVSSEGVIESAPEEFVPTAEFKPVVPLPALVDMKTGEEDEDKLFGERVKLFRYDSEGKQWKERGIGELKILYQKSNKKFRILMRREQVFKLCANHYILPEMKLTPLATSDRSWVWIAQDYSERDLKQEQFAAKFKSVDVAKLFFNVVTKCQSDMKSLSEQAINCHSIETNVQDPCGGNKAVFSKLFKPVSETWECMNCHQKTTVNESSCVFCQTPRSNNIAISSVSDHVPVSKDQKPLSELFKPKAGSWECDVCYVNNKSSDVNCLSCNSAKNISQSKSSEKPAFGSIQSRLGSISVSSSQSSADIKPQTFADLFKPQPGSWDCQACYVNNNADKIKCVACETLKPGSTTSKSTESSTQSIFGKFQSSTDTKAQTFADLFKPQPGSWECQACYVNNTAEKIKCVSCETLKPGTTTSKSIETSTQSIFGKFQFGASTMSTAAETSSTFSFGTPKSSDGEFVFGMRQTLQPSTFSFGLSALKGLGKETGGFKPDLNTNTASTAPAVFGGATQKSDTVAKSAASITIPTVTDSLVPTTSAVSSFGITSPDTSVEFRFGSPQKYEFSFSGVRPRSPTKTPKSPRSPATPSDVDEDEDVEPSDVDNIYFQPVIPLPPKVDVKTGEENEIVLFCKRAKLFRFADSEWKERGIGDLKILFDESLKKARLLMRRDQVLKVCLNNSLIEEMTFDWRGDKTLTWAATDFSEAKPSPELFAVRFKTHELALEFKDALKEAFELIKGENILPKKENDSAVISVNSASFSFKMDSGKNETPSSTVFSLASRFGTSPLQSKSLFGNTSPATSNSSAVISSSEGKTLNSTISSSSQPSFSFDVKESKSHVTGFQKPFESCNTQSIFGGSDFKFNGSPKSAEVEQNPESGFNDEVQAVYQATATPEKRALAEKLMLPSSFYLYESKPPCKGCIGCTDYIPPYKDEISESEETKASVTSAVSTEAQSLFPNASVKFSFADLADSSGFNSLTQPASASKNAFAGAGTPLFASLNNSTEGDADNDNVAQGPDIHFEPVIPMPELVDVKTGEEDETPVFVKRAKLYRYDAPTKMWKERGVGDFKILQHKQKCSFRIILRRDQVHKIACNHSISEGMELQPMNTSETALCWNAVDYSEGYSEASQFAVKFKTRELLAEFRNKFEECKAILSQRYKDTNGKISLVSDEQQLPIDEISIAESSATDDCTESDTSRSTVDPNLPSDSSLTLSNIPQSEEERITETETLEEPDDESDEEDIMFEKRVSFEVYDDVKQCYQMLGIGRLRILYDDTVFGYRIAMISDQDIIWCDHIIAIQTSLRVENKKAMWGAIDLSIEPPKRRQFRASFSSAEALAEFRKLFEDGKDAAVHSEIVEKSDNYLQPNQDRQPGLSAN